MHDDADTQNSEANAVGNTLLVIGLQSTVYIRPYLRHANMHA